MSWQKVQKCLEPAKATSWIFHPATSGYKNALIKIYVFTGIDGPMKNL